MKRHFVVSVEEALTIFELAKQQCSGLAKRATFAMSHCQGKIAVVGLDDVSIVFKFHQAADPDDIGKTMVYRRNPGALWFDDYSDPVSEHRVR